MARREKIEFTNRHGINLAGLLELPDEIKGYALFAHCFTCGKDITSASRMARSLVEKGFVVMRFDFTGLGASEGDFANSNFSSNVSDLIDAASFLRENHEAPALMIGHSLGGTAVLRAASHVPECRAVVTVGSPAEAGHVIKQFACDLDSINADGEAKVSLAGRDFTIKKQFIEDLDADTASAIAQLKKPLLVMHSPVDEVVSINQAEIIYREAKHPKSFVSLDKASHLLSRKEDAVYVAQTIANWASRYLDVPEDTVANKPSLGKGIVRVTGDRTRYRQDIFSNDHHWLADEPVALGGGNLGPNPFEHLLAGLGACTTMTLRIYADRKSWNLDGVAVDLSISTQRVGNTDKNESVIKREISLRGDLTDEQRERLLEIADRCPVHRTLHGEVEIVSELK